uniref:Protein TsetseEP domain-containing protein n=1 Tax=Anopheles funestus TaxID=62324 RepID=A0A1I8JU70_ANOFN
MARLSSSLYLLVGCLLLQRTFADPRPEFGSIGTVQSSLTIKNTANSITPLLNAVDDRNGFELKTDYDLFVQVLPLMESLGTQVTELGPPIASAIVTAVPKTDRNYDGVFDPIVNAIADFQDFIETEQASTRTTLTDLLGVDIDHLFGDSFGNMANALTQVESAMLRLKGALRTAIIRNGRAQVDPTIVTNVVVAVSFFKATISPVEYTIQSTIDNIELADDFLYGLEDMNESLLQDLQTYTSEFEDSLTNDMDLVEAAIDDLEDDWQAINDGLSDATSNIASSSDYEDGAYVGLEKFRSAFSALYTYTENIPDDIEGYIETANTYFTDYVEVLVPRSYEAITYLIEVLVAGGPHSRFCFFKYSPRLINYYAMLINDVERCYNLESYRLGFLEDVTKAVCKLILFDVEDLLDNLTACNTKTPPGPCLTAIGPYYIALGDKTEAKVASLEAYADAELTASVKRLGSCVVTSRLKNMQALVSASDDVETCHEMGPQDPN